MKRIFVLAVIALMVASVSVSAQSRRCQNIGGALMTSIDLIPYGAPGHSTNLGPAYGDLAGSVAATVVSESPVTFQHYWVTNTGEIINFKPAVLHPSPVNQSVIAVQWGDYVAEVSGGTGKYDGATGKLEAFGLVDFASGTVVFRYRGSLCLVDMPPNATTKK